MQARDNPYLLNMGLSEHIGSRGVACPNHGTISVPILESLNLVEVESGNTMHVVKSQPSAGGAAATRCPQLLSKR